ncbi:ataxin-2 homolog [Drosophila innubila]|uniref:ataxin-2 homolog n=1 Tax=Drosophila innubila TaxID=198719 RepID=UPI00148D247C|nr:ataxin-2 homolog [Drosophila innubila]
MTTTISKHEVQQQQQQQQHQQQQQQQHPMITTTATTATTAATAANTGPLCGAMQLQFDTLNNNDIAPVTASCDEPQSAVDTAQNALHHASQTKVLKRRSLLNFKSFDFHIKSLYSGLRVSGAATVGHKSASASASQSQSQSQSRSSSLDVGGILDAPVATQRRIPPHLRIEGVDAEPDPDPDPDADPESMKLLLDYTASPFTPRRNSSTQLLPINRGSSLLSPYYLSPYMAVGGAGGGGGAGSIGGAGTTAAGDDCGSGNIRRSSTSDIVNCRRRGSTASGNSRRPSTSDLLRRARERRGSEARMGRSVSHSGMRGMGGGGVGGGGGGGCMGGRRTSMAF